MVTEDEKEALFAKHDALDDNCKEIFFTLLVYRTLRHNKLMNSLKQLGIKMSRPTLDTHLKHLLDSGLVECKTAFQSSEYSLTNDIYELLRPLSMEEIKQHLEFEKEEEKLLPKGLRPLNITRKALYAHLSDEQINDSVEKDVEYLLISNLLELKENVTFELNRKFDSDKAFWKFVGNPMYRMLEKSIALRCRDCPRYKEKLFDRIEEMQRQFDDKYNRIMPKDGIP